MENKDLNDLIQQVRKLSPIEQQLLIKVINTENIEESLTEKEKQFVQISEMHINSLKEANKKLDKVISKFE